MAWDDFEKAFPNGKSGSKIMLTSCNERLAAYADLRSQPVVPEMLSEKQRWDLFCKRTFNNADPGDFPHLKHCREKMVKKCGGLPLEDLKSCFLYTSLFPEDFRIERRRLIGVWIAEGYIRQEGEETLHEAAENALMEFISRGMVQVEEMNSLGRVKSCRLHDILRDFSIVKAKEECFGETFKANISSSLDMSSIEKSLCTRLDVHIFSERDEISRMNIVSIRTH
ncbi:hypothetical protein Syun_030422 [Stephania yunnanensis]|uniref:NB-ARC domain-containing protein n=1 Tax=Stephania yunnanensis TaxID=152371 RepID=A0AAP0EEZ3_9MAGN